eukprot:1159279-Pelagomonas_calceolata.AAC.22
MLATPSEYVCPSKGLHAFEHTCLLSGVHAQRGLPSHGSGFEGASPCHSKCDCVSACCQECKVGALICW